MLKPLPSSRWNYSTAAHLLNRAGFGGSPADIEKLVEMGPAKAVDHFVDFDKIPEDYPRPPWADPDPSTYEQFTSMRRKQIDMRREARDLPENEKEELLERLDRENRRARQQLRRSQIQKITELRGWWIHRMATTSRPLQEKLTLFWHGHFATGNTKVRDTRMMLRQNEMLRANAAGSFRDLLAGILTDPAMLVYLDNGENRKGHPNENFGRELLELFTMGVGNYTEQDIREASRAFTGWTNDVLEFRFDPATHDDGEKTFLGRTGAFNGDDIIDIILDTPVTADYISAKLYRFFVREELDDSTRVALGATFRDAGYELKPLLRRVFLSRDFYSPASYATQVKSPVHLVVSTYRKLGLTALPTIPDFGRLTARLGQTLFNPPNVAGWAGGRTWITPASLLERGNLFRDVLLPDTDGFWAPDRALPGIYARVGERIEQGLNITAATQEGDAESSMLADRDEDYNTRYGGYMGYVMAYERLNLVFRRTADLDLAQMLQDARATTVEEVVDHFVQRFLRVPLGPDSRTVLVEHLRGDLGDDRIPTTSTSQVERALRSLLYLVLSAPEYQLA